MNGIKETKVYSINDFLNWHENKELELSPKYQRKNVWNSRAESYLIDTIIRGLPIPQVFLRQSIDTVLRKTYREVIDGQQRLRSIIKFQNDEFPILKAHNHEYGGRYYSSLDETVKMQFLDYQIPVELIKTNDDNIVYDMFMRVNTNSNTLNKQELRNAKYWGDFKVLVYDLASEWRYFFSEYKTFQDSDFLRMMDAEFVSSLLILLIEGIVQDTPGNLDKYYSNHDSMIVEDINENRMIFMDNMKSIEKIFRNMDIKMNYLNKKNYIYTIFAFMLFSEGKLKTQLPVKLSSNYNIMTLPKILIELESSLNRDEGFTMTLIDEFKELHQVRTTSEAERKSRISLLINYINMMEKQHG